MIFPFLENILKTDNIIMWILKHSKKLQHNIINHFMSKKIHYLLVGLFGIPSPEVTLR